MTVLELENISKQYRLGEVGTGTLHQDLKRWWYGIRGKEDPFLKIGEVNDRTKKGNSDFVWALKDINLKVEQGETLGIIGRNGAGKSTLLKLLSKVTKPTTGTIKYKGRIASLLEVGTGFNPELTGRENIYMNGTIMGMTRSEITRKLDEIVNFAGVERYLDTPTKRYSSGMTVRLGFAVAAFLEAEILIVDEVLAVGDAEFQKKAIGKMNDVSKGEGRTVLFVSHNMAAVQNLCSNCIFLQYGQVSVIGRTSDIISQYLKSNSTISKDIMIYSLIDIIRTRGNKKVIREAWFTNTDNKIVNSYFMGETIIVNVRVQSDIVLDNILVGFGIEDSEGRRLTSLNNEITGQGAYYSIQNGVFVCTFENLNLIEGDYYISLSIVKDQVEWIDYVEQALNLRVESYDIYGTGKMITKEQGNFFINGNIIFVN